MCQVKRKAVTLIASVRMAAITSRDPPKTRLPGRLGSYSQMAVAFSTAAIFVMWPIMSTLPRLMTCARKLQWNYVQQPDNNNSNKNQTVVVVRDDSIQGLDGREHPRLPHRLCCCYLYYPMSLCKADLMSRCHTMIQSQIDQPLFRFCA